MRDAVGATSDGCLGELAGRDARRRRLVAGGRRHRHGPDVRRPIAVDVAEAGDAVGAVDGLGDDAHVALARLVACGLLASVTSARRACGRRERDRLAVGRPLGVAGAARHVGDGPRLAAGHGHARGSAPAAAGRPSRPTRTKASRRPSGDQRGLVSRMPLVNARGGSLPSASRSRSRCRSVLLLVDGHAHEGDLRAVGRDLRIGDPDEREEILLGDRPALRAAGVRDQTSSDAGWPRMMSQ